MTVTTTARLTVDEYHRLANDEVFDANLRVELLAGEIRVLPPPRPGHAGLVRRFTHILSRYIGDVVILSVHDPIDLGPYSEPQPDIALLRARPDFYRAFHPRPIDIFLVIEVADTSLTYDRTVKGPEYARAGVVAYWVVDAKNRIIEAFSTPSLAGYRTTRILRAGDLVPLPGRPEIVVSITDLLGAS